MDGANWLIEASAANNIEALLSRNDELVHSTINAFCDQMYNSVLRLPPQMRDEFFESIENQKGPAYEGVLQRWRNESTC